MKSSFFDPLIRMMLSPIGIGVLAALDSTVVFWLPLGIDLAMVIMGARHPQLFWLYPIIGAAGSLVGAATTYRVGEAGGEAGLKKLIPGKKLDRVKRRVSQSGALTLAALDMIPPPFPFTLFLLAAGALQVNKTRFFVTLGIVRFVRFGAESSLGALYGARLAMRIGSSVAKNVVGIFVLAAIVAAVVAGVRLMGRRRARR